MLVFMADVEGRAPWAPTLREGERLSDVPLETMVTEALGTASMCWENPGGAGVFDSSMAGWVAQGLMVLLRARMGAVAEALGQPGGHPFVTGSGMPGMWMAHGQAGAILPCQGPPDAADAEAVGEVSAVGMCRAWAVVAGRVDPARPVVALLDAGWSFADRAYRCPRCS